MEKTVGKTVDFVGKQVGMLFVKERVENTFKTKQRPSGCVSYLCECRCGKEIVYTSRDLSSGHTTSCGCTYGGSTYDLVGKVFYRLIVIEETKQRRGKRVLWLCKCECGNLVLVSTTCLLSGSVKSCGCLRRERAINMRGPNHPSWDTSKTEEDRRVTMEKREGYFPELVTWREEVYKRDKYVCQICGFDKGNNLNCHHMNSWHTFPEDRYNTYNGVTLCVTCHKAFHSKYGKKNNTFRQFVKFYQNSKELHACQVV